MPKDIVCIEVRSSYEGSLIDHATFEVTESLCRNIVERRGVWQLAKQVDSDFYEMSFWDGTPDFFEGDNEEDPARVECVQMVVRETGVLWTAYPKHCDYEVRTEEIRYEDFVRVPSER